MNLGPNAARLAAPDFPEMTRPIVCAPERIADRVCERVSDPVRRIVQSLIEMPPKDDDLAGICSVVRLINVPTLALTWSHSQLYQGSMSSNAGMHSSSAADRTRA